MTNSVKPKFLNQISLGTWITIIMIAVGGAGAFQAVRSDTESIKEALSYVRSEIDATRQEGDAVASRVRVLENEQARADERFSNILAFLTRIDGRLERIERGQ
jgi:outer membrane murein-binding lipoprotein Lpp